MPVIVGAGSNATAEAVDLNCHASQAGADAVLVVTPYYNKPTQNGLMRHYEAVADASDVPVVIYDIPGRSVVSMDIDTMVALAEHDNITGVKDSSQDLSRPTMLATLSDQDPACYPAKMEQPCRFALPVAGCISVTANIAPRLLSDSMPHGIRVISLMRWR